MYYDLNIPYGGNLDELQRTLAFLADCQSPLIVLRPLLCHTNKLSVGHNTVALNYTMSDKIPAEIKNSIPDPLPIEVPASMHILRRCTLHLSDTSYNHRISQIAAAYDIFVIRPTNEASLSQACQTLECDIVSLDLTQRFPFYFKHKTFSAALQRGMRFEVCYGPGIMNSDGGASRRNLISNATQLIRATRGRGLVISSEAKRALTCRAPADIVNLAVMWGLASDRAVESIAREARNVVVQAGLKRRSYRGVIDVLKGGETAARPAQAANKGETKKASAKRKADALDDSALDTVALPKALSKREQKRQAKKAKIESHSLLQAKESGETQKNGSSMPQTKSTTTTANGDPD